MSNVNTAWAVSFMFRIRTAEWYAKALPSLKDFFAGRVPKATPKVVQPADQKPARKPGKITIQDAVSDDHHGVEECGLAEFYDALVEKTYQVFSAKIEERDGMVVIKFMLCLSAEVSWDKPRNYEGMQEALATACRMASWGILLYDNPYKNDNEPARRGRALSINANRPDWLLGTDERPVLEGVIPKTPKNEFSIDRRGMVVVKTVEAIKVS